MRVGKKKPRPPYGKSFQPVPNTGVRVVIGRDPDIWSFAKAHHCPIMVLPAGETPEAYCWPSDGKPALIHERGTLDDERLDALAAVLLRVGASSVVAIREALPNDYDCRVFYDAGVCDAVA